MKSYGATSRDLNSRGFIGKVGGGNAAHCIENSYEKDFLIEARLRDLRYQEVKAR